MAGSNIIVVPNIRYRPGLKKMIEKMAENLWVDPISIKGPKCIIFFVIWSLSLFAQWACMCDNNNFFVGWLKNYLILHAKRNESGPWNTDSCLKRGSELNDCCFQEGPGLKTSAAHLCLNLAWLPMFSPGVLPYRVCAAPIRVYFFAPFWSEIEYRLCLSWSEFGYRFQGNAWKYLSF